MFKRQNNFHFIVAYMKMIFFFLLSLNHIVDKERLKSLAVAYRGSTHWGGGGAPSGKVCVCVIGVDLFSRLGG